MQNANRVFYEVVSSGSVVAGGVPIVIWGLSEALGTTITVTDTDGAGGVGSNDILVHSFIVGSDVVSFPFGIQAKNGASLTSGDATVLYTKI